MKALINFTFMPICFASCNVKDLWSTVIQRIFIWKPKYPSQMFMCMHDFFPIDCSYVKIDNKLQKKSPKLNGEKNFQQHFSVYWKVNVQQPLRTPYIILYQLLIHLIYGVLWCKNVWGLFFLYLRVWVFDLFISMGEEFFLALHYVQMNDLNDMFKIWMTSKTTETRYLLLVKKVIKIQIQFKIQFLV